MHKLQISGTNTLQEQSEEIHNQVQTSPAESSAPNGTQRITRVTGAYALNMAELWRLATNGGLLLFLIPLPLTVFLPLKK